MGSDKTNIDFINVADKSKGGSQESGRPGGGRGDGGTRAALPRGRCLSNLRPQPHNSFYRLSLKDLGPFTSNTLALYEMQVICF